MDSSILHTSEETKLSDVEILSLFKQPTQLRILRVLRLYPDIDYLKIAELSDKQEITIIKQAEALLEKGLIKKHKEAAKRNRRYSVNKELLDSYFKSYSLFLLHEKFKQVPKTNHRFEISTEIIVLLQLADKHIQDSLSSWFNQSLSEKLGLKTKFPSINEVNLILTHEQMLIVLSILVQKKKKVKIKDLMGHGISKIRLREFIKRLKEAGLVSLLESEDLREPYYQLNIDRLILFVSLLKEYVLGIKIQQTGTKTHMSLQLPQELLKEIKKQKTKNQTLKRYISAHASKQLLNELRELS